MNTTTTLPSINSRQITVSGGAVTVLSLHRGHRRMNGRSRITFGQTLDEVVLEYPVLLAEVVALRAKLDTLWLRSCRRVGEWFGLC